ncbi:DUF5955 family protein [Streptacidiphilus sp. N1-12]|uniref:DUF5955 family protein n=2 Tax=Streptacidiphilus alkalitolerans TaxID=3342712 RepID=A0ABV6V8Y1_9ACTN
MRFGRGNDRSSDGVAVSGQGNQINTGRVGRDMRNTYVAGGGSDDPRVVAAQGRLAELRAELDAHSSDVHSIDNCREAVSRIDEELRSAAPDRRRIRETLDLLSLSIGSVASVVTSAEILKTALDAFIN